MPCLSLRNSLTRNYGWSISIGPWNTPRVQTSPSATEEINNLETKVEILKTSNAENWNEMSMIFDSPLGSSALTQPRSQGAFSTREKRPGDEVVQALHFFLSSLHDYGVKLSKTQTCMMIFFFFFFIFLACGPLQFNFRKIRLH